MLNKCHFQQYLFYSEVISFIGAVNGSITVIPNYSKILTNLIVYSSIVFIFSFTGINTTY